MKTHDLLRELLHRSGLKASALAEKLKDQGVQQAQLSRFINGKTQEPKRSTLAPVADYFGISVEALFNEKLASMLLEEMENGTFVVLKSRANPHKANLSWEPPNDVLKLLDAIDYLADRINEIEDSEHRELIASKLQTLARAPDSMKSRNAVAKALTWEDSVKREKESGANGTTG